MTVRVTKEHRALALAALLSLEAALVGYSAARTVYGPISLSPAPVLWVAWAVVVLLTHLGLTLQATYPLLRRDPECEQPRQRLYWLSTLPFLAFFPLGFLLLQFRPDAIRGWVWSLLSSIEPYPTLATATGLLLMFLLRVSAVTLGLPKTSPARIRLCSRAASIAIPAALLLMGLFQGSVYIVPLGNAFVRVWSVADALGSGVPYPVTITEPPSVAAGSPPYIWDLPLYPALVAASFALLGHNTAAVHLPAALSSALFPLSLYLLIREVTGSRIVALVFATLASLFPYLRLYALNLPDPDPFLLTILCLTAYFYLRALGQAPGTRHQGPGVGGQGSALSTQHPEPRTQNSETRSLAWVLAGLSNGLLALARPEGILYSAFIALGVLVFRPLQRGAGVYPQPPPVTAAEDKPLPYVSLPWLKQLALFGLSFGLLLGPMVYTWVSNFGFLWPQNYNRTLSLDHPLSSYNALAGSGSLGRYARGLGLDEGWALALLVLFLLAVALGLLLMAVRDRHLLAVALPGVLNTATVFFTNPWVSNAFHTADFFRHISYGIPFMVATAAYGFHRLFSGTAARPRLKLIGYLCLALLVAAIIREGDILANPSATYRPGATQVLTSYPYLSMQTILEHPMPLPRMSYFWNGEVTYAYPTGIEWPEDMVAFVKPLDMAFDSRGRPFGYASVVVFLLALCFAMLAEGPAAHFQQRK